MALFKLINIEVAYATPELQKVISLEVSAGSSIEEAIQQSGILVMFPEIDLTQQKVGVFSEPRALSDMVHKGDRVEIYRRLVIDPMEARRLRAEKK